MPHQSLFAGALSWLLTYAVHSSVLLGAVWLLLRWLPPRGLLLRERLWKLALIGPLLTASLQLGLGARPWLGRLEWSPALPREVAELDRPAPALDTPPIGTTAHVPEAPTGSVASRQATPRPEPRVRRDAPTPRTTPAAAPDRTSTAPAPTAERGSQETAVQSPAAPSFTPREDALARESGPRATEEPPGPAALPASTRLSTPPSWPGLVLVLWAALGLFGVLGITASFLALKRRLLGRELLREGPLVETLEALRRRAGLAGRVRLSISSRVTAPFSTGVFLPEICLPRAVVANLTPAQQEVLLAHELGHLLRRDPVWFTASFLVERLFFFQPMNRVARRELAELAELACDDWAVRWTGSRLALASCLTEVAGWIVDEPRRPLALPGLTAPRSPLGRRVARLLDDRRSPASEPRGRSFSVAALAALGLTVVAVPGISTASPRTLREAIDPPEYVTLPPSGAASHARDAQPAPTAVEAPAETAAFEELPLARMRLELEAQLQELEVQLAELHAELVQRELDRRFADELAAIEKRMATLRLHQARASALLAALTTPHTPAPAWR